MALPRSSRLKLRQEFNAVYQRGRRYHSTHLTLRALRLKPNSSGHEWRAEAAALEKPEQPTRIGISISQKVSKRAVVRNRIKRQLRAALRILLVDISPGWLLVIGVRPIAIQCDYKQFLQELKQLLTDAEVLDGRSRRCLL